MNTARSPQARRRVVLAVGAAAGTLLGGVLVAGPASAAPAGVTVAISGDTLTVTANPATRNDLTLSDSGSAITLNGVAVPGATLTSIHHLVLNGGAKDDTLRVTDPRGVMPEAHMVGGEGTNVLIGGSAGDTLVGGSGVDDIDGNGGADVIDSGPGIDKVTGGTGVDTVRLGADADQFTWNAGDGSDHLDGDAGTDTLIVNNGPNAALGGLAALFPDPAVPSRTHIAFDNGADPSTFDLNVGGFEAVKMNKGDEVRMLALPGSDIAVLRLSFDGGPNDHANITGTQGPDRIGIQGSPSAGVTVTGVGPTVLVTGATSLTAVGLGGDDTIDASRLTAGTLRLSEFGDGIPRTQVPGNNTLIGSPGTDQLVGGLGADRIEGHGGGDDIDGGGGPDVIIP